MAELQRGIDHLVLCANDLERIRERYHAFGFTTTPPALHPFGTGNSLVQLQGNFLELITVANPEQIAPPEEGVFSFGDSIQRSLKRREGMSMLVFESRDAVADQAEFAAKGVETYEPLHFQRQATLPDGSQVTVAFSLAFATSPELPETVFFTCQQHSPEYFWKPDYQRHANGAQIVEEVVMVAASPGPAAKLLGQLQGLDAVESAASNLQVATARGYVTVLPPDQFTGRFGTPPPGSDKAHFAAYRIAVDDIDRTASVLTANGVAHRRNGPSLLIDADTAFGVVLEFTAE